jgi:PilZ domain
MTAGLIGERRARPRVRLHWPVSIMQNEGEPRVLSTVTENLSSQGFFCLVDQPLPAGQRVECILKLPQPGAAEGSQVLRCAAQVVWISPQEDGRFGIGCRIQDYTFVI